MKNVLKTLLVLILMAATGIGGYEIGTHKVKVTPKDTKASSTAKQPEIKSDEPKQISLDTLLANLQKQYPSVQQSYVYTQSKDPNDNLGKAGYYTAGAEFYDTRTNTAPDGDAFGADSGGAIEVYASAADAEKRVEYLKQFQGQAALDPGAAEQVGNVVVRASSKYNATDQKQMINYLAAQVKALQE